MNSSDLLLQFNDFRRKLKAQIQSNEKTKSPQKNYVKTQSSPQQLSSSIKSKINLNQHQSKIQDKCNTNQLVQNGNQMESFTINTRFQCITHEKLQSKQKNVQSFKTPNSQHSSNKKEIIVNKLLNQEQIHKFYSTLQQISEDEVKQLPNEYQQLLKQLATFVNEKLLQ